MFDKDNLIQKIRDGKATVTIKKFSELEPKFHKLIKYKTYKTVLVIESNGLVERILPIKNDSLGDSLEAMFR